MDISNNNYTETLVFFHVISNYSLTEKYKSTYFSNKTLQTLFDLVRPHIMQYREEPTEEQVLMIAQRENVLTSTTTQDVIHSLWQIRNQIGQYSKDWLDDCAKSYAEWNNFVGGVQKLSSYLITTQADVTVETCHEYVQKVKSMFTEDTSFTFHDSLGHDFFDPAEHKTIQAETKSTGYPFLDKCLNGGWYTKSLFIIAGAPKVGKSQWLCNLCANSVKSGDNSAYITLEMGVDKVNKRIGANLFNIPYNEYDKFVADQDAFKRRMQAFYNDSFITPGALVVEQFPTSALTPLELESFLLNIESARSTPEKPFKFKRIYVDYVNIMKPSRPGMNGAETYMKIKTICEDLRAVMIRNDWTGISLTQLNRAAMNASDIYMDSISESTGTLATADSVWGIICTNMMKNQGYYYLKALALRDSDQMSNRKRYKFNTTYLRIEEDPDEDILTEGMPLPEEFMVGADDYQKQTYSNQHRYNGPRKQNDQQQTSAPVQAPPISQQQTPSLGATELKISGYDLFQ